MCLTPKLAIFSMSELHSLFTPGIIGSMRTETGMPCLAIVSTALRRSEGLGAFGSSILAVSSSSVVIVIATVAGASLRISASLATSVLFVIIWIRHELCASALSVSRVNPVSRSILGYGSEEFESEMVSPLSFAASRARRFSRFCLGLHKWNRGT